MTEARTTPRATLPTPGAKADTAVTLMAEELTLVDADSEVYPDVDHRRYVCEHGEDMPEIREWSWSKHFESPR